MIRPVSILCMLLAIGSGLYLYRVKYRAQLLDREISTTLRAADDSRARAALLRADYALLNDPIRLQELVDQYLPLKTTQPTQFTTLADLERRLPPIGIAPPEPVPEPEIPADVIRPEPRTAVANPRAPEPRIIEPRTAEALPRPPSPPAATSSAPRTVAVATPAPIAAPVAAPPPAAAPSRPAIAVPAPAPAPPVAAPAGPPAVTAVRPPTPLAPPPAMAPTPAVGSAAPPATQLVVRGAAPSPTGPTATIPSRQAAPQPAVPPATESGPPVVRSALGMARRTGAQPAMPPGGGGSN